MAPQSIEGAGIEETWDMADTFVLIAGAAEEGLAPDVDADD